MARVVSRILLLLSLLLFAGRVSAVEDATSDPAHERTGHTELSGPQPNVAEPPAVSDATRDTPPPADAPRVGEEQVKLPPVAAGFSTYDGGWFRITYYPSSRERVEPLIAAADEAKRELEEWLGRSVLAKVRIDVARTPGEMATLAPRGAPYPEYASGVAYPELDLVLLTLTPRFPNESFDITQVFRHELAHVALSEAVGPHPIPRWFNEGFAVMASGETSFERMWTLSSATVADRLLPLSQVERSFPSDENKASIAYAEAADVVRFLIRREDRHRFRALVRELGQGRTLDMAAREAYGVDLVTLEHEWREDVAKRYTFWPILCSGTVVWGGVMGLFVWGWRKRRARSRATLARWARDEAREDDLRRLEENARIHIVLQRAPNEASTPLPPAAVSEIEVPRVQHDGTWHTLH
jgi:Peptidase MA superfamily